MQQLIEGIHRFQNEVFGGYQELFQHLSTEGQNPHTLFITCSDSRVLAELITHSKPGDLFVVKNVGNIVPPAGVEGATNSTAAAVEYAVTALNVEDIVVCGHSQCGAMRALLGPREEMDSMPHLAEWLEIAAPVREVIARHYGHLPGEEERVNAAAQENCLHALEGLQSYPAVRERLAAGTLRLHAWFYKIATGQLYAYRPEARQYEPLDGRTAHAALEPR